MTALRPGLRLPGRHRLTEVAVRRVDHGHTDHVARRIAPVAEFGIRFLASRRRGPSRNGHRPGDAAGYRSPDDWSRPDGYRRAHCSRAPDRAARPQRRLVAMTRCRVPAAPLTAFATGALADPADTLRHD